MSRQAESVFGGEIAGPFFDGTATDLDRLPAVGAHEVVMMMVTAQPVQRFAGVSVQNVHGLDLGQ